MPTYDYYCDGCEHRFEQQQGFHDDPLTWCPECHAEELRRIFHSPYAAVRVEPTKLAHYAARQTEKMGHYEYESKVLKNHEPKERPWWRDNEKIDYRLANLSDKGKKHFIETGNVDSNEIKPNITLGQVPEHAKEEAEKSRFHPPKTIKSLSKKRKNQ